VWIKERIAPVKVGPKGYVINRPGDNRPIARRNTPSGGQRGGCSQGVHRSSAEDPKDTTRASVRRSTSATNGRSATEELGPRENRTRPALAAAEAPIARRTWEGFSEPAEQAEPAEAQIPSKSSPARSDRLSQQGNVAATVLTKHPARGDQSEAPGSKRRSFRSSAQA